MPTCPAGHQSVTVDYCDECGAPLASLDAELDPGPAEPPPGTELLRRPEPERGAPCPVCALARTAADRFCEGCGHDFAAPADGPAPRGWVAVITADRGYFDQLAEDGWSFPSGRSAREVPLTTAELTIGRSESGGIQPDVDLSGAVADPGVSRRHAVLVRAEDGSYGVVEAGSTNGTTLNEMAEPIEPGLRVALTDGDRLHLGRWTTITIRATAPGDGLTSSGQ